VQAAVKQFNVQKAHNSLEDKWKWGIVSGKQQAVVM
jgi:hypothetical protein